MMKLAIRIFALSVVVAGATAAATTSRIAPAAFPSHQSGTFSLPGPVCGPHTCPLKPSNPKAAR